MPTAGYFVAIEAGMSAAAACDVLRAPGLPLGELWAGARSKLAIYVVKVSKCKASGSPRRTVRRARAGLHTCTWVWKKLGKYICF